MLWHEVALAVLNKFTWSPTIAIAPLRPGDL